MMRIITGSARGVRLDTLESEMTRPTTERAKEAVFSILRARTDFSGARVLDLFAGLGWKHCLPEPRMRCWWISPARRCA